MQSKRTTIAIPIDTIDPVGITFDLGRFNIISFYRRTTISGSFVLAVNLF